MRKLYKNIICILVMHVIIFVTLLFVYQLWNKKIDVPYFYIWGDASGFLGTIKNIAHGKSVVFYDDVYAFALLKVISFFTSDVGVIANIYWLLGYFLAATISYCFFRNLNFDHIVSVCSSVIFVFLPYHYLRLCHPGLCECYSIPIAMYLLYYLIFGFYKDCDHKNMIRENIKVIVLVVMVAVGGIYYAFFAAILVFIFGIYSAFKYKNKYFIQMIIFTMIFGVLLLGFAFLVIPNLKDMIIYGNSVRDLNGLYVYSLNLMYMLLPIPGHRIDALDEFIRTIYAGTNLTRQNEQYMAAMGFVMSLGFIISIMVKIFDINIPGRDKIKKLGMVNIVIVLIAIYGGFNILIGYFGTYIIRCYNRMSVFIALNSLVVVAIVIEEVIKKFNFKKIIQCFICLSLLIIAILDQTSASYANYAALNEYMDMQYVYYYKDIEEYYYSLKMFAKELDDISDENANIYMTTRDYPDPRLFTNIPIMRALTLSALFERDDIYIASEEDNVDDNYDWNEFVENVIENNGEGILLTRSYYPDEMADNIENIIKSYGFYEVYRVEYDDSVYFKSNK